MDTPKPTNKEAKRSTLYKGFYNNIAHDEKNINTEKFNEKLNNESPTYLLKDLLHADKFKKWWNSESC